jgi:MFS family permease
VTAARYGRAAGSNPDAFDLRFTAPLVLGSTLNPINSSIVATALVPIAAALDVSLGRVTLLVTVLYVASAIAQPAMGRLGELFGPRRIFLLGAALVAVSGAVGALATNLTVLIIARVLLGVGTSAGFPSSMMLIRRRADTTGEAPGGALSALVIGSQVTVLLGLPMGGVLVSLAGWRATFWINIPIALLVLATAWRWTPRDPAIPARAPRQMVSDVDIAGILLFGGMLAATIAFLSTLRNTEWGWLLVALASAGAFGWWELRARRPFIDLRSLVANRSLAATYVRAAGGMLVAYCFMYGLTQWLQETRGLPATLTGLLIVPMSAAGALVSGPVGKRNLVRAPLLISGVLTVVVAIGLWMTGQGTPLALVILLTTIVGLAVGLSTVGNQAAVFDQAGPHETGIAAGLLRTAGYVGAIASGSLIGLVFHQGPSDAGLHDIAFVLLAVSLLVLVLIVLDRRLPHRIASRRP